ncbi:MAG: type II toxin-antitoxin system VapC family toxin [Candidatus Levyibacteriota bacterium]
MRLVIDTSILIDHLRGGAKWEELLNTVEHDAEIYLPTVGIFELFSGKSTANPQVAREINEFIKFFQKVELTEKIAKGAGELYRDINKTLGAPDYIIAATTLELSASLVTLNKKHFQQITRLNLYPL